MMKTNQITLPFEPRKAIHITKKKWIYTTQTTILRISHSMWGLILYVFSADKKKNMDRENTSEFMSIQSRRGIE